MVEVASTATLAVQEAPTPCWLDVYGQLLSGLTIFGCQMLLMLTNMNRHLIVYLSDGVVAKGAR